MPLYLSNRSVFPLDMNISNFFLSLKGIRLIYPSVFFKTLLIDIFGNSCEIGSTDYMSVIHQEMDWRRQATSHYQSQC